MPRAVQQQHNCPRCQAEAKEALAWEAGALVGFFYFCETCNAPTEEEGGKAKLYPIRP